MIQNKLNKKEAEFFLLIVIILAFSQLATATTYETVDDVYYSFNWDLVKFQVRSCSDSTCSGIPFKGPDNTSNTWFIYPDRYSTKNINLTNVSANRYAQYKASLSTEHNTISPKLFSTMLGYNLLGGLFYDASGNLTSQIFDLGSNPDIISLSWNEEISGVTDVTFQTRSGSSNASLGSWSASYTNPAGEAWKSSDERYVQYRLFLETSDISVTPKLLDITINYTSGSISEGVSFEKAVYDQGVFIEGTDSLIYPTANNLNADEGTIELWLNMSWDDSLAHYILEDSNSVFELYKDSSDNLVFDLFSVQATYSASSLLDFHHITITWKANDKIYLYIDSIERDSAAIANVPTIGETLYIGSDSSGSNQLNGVIDELIISDTKKELN